MGAVNLCELNPRHQQLLHVPPRASAVALARQRARQNHALRTGRQRGPKEACSHTSGFHTLIKINPLFLYTLNKQMENEVFKIPFTYNKQDMEATQQSTDG